MWTEREKRMISRAVELAEYAHRGQFYGDGRPYICHVSDVVTRVMELGGDAIDVCIAWLHDAYEDGPAAIRPLTAAVMGQFGDEGDEVTAAVEIITLLEDEDYHDEYLARVIMNDRTLRVKRADLWANHIKGGRDTEKYRRAWGIINWPKDD